MSDQPVRFVIDKSGGLLTVHYLPGQVLLSAGWLRFRNPRKVDAVLVSAEPVESRAVRIVFADGYERVLTWDDLEAEHRELAWWYGAW